MRKVVIVSLLFAVVLWSVSCAIPRKPEFKTVKNTEILSSTASEIVVASDVILHNPNSVGVTIVKTDIDVYANSVKMTAVAQKEQVEMPANSDFALPVEVTISKKDLLSSDNIVGGIVSTLVKRSVDLNYKGTVTVKVMKFEFDVPVDETKTIPLKQDSEE